MGSDDLTLRVLVEIRDGIRTTNERVETLERRVDRLGDQVAESDAHTTAAVDGTTQAVREVYTLLRDRLELRDRVERCERDIDELKRKLD